MKASRYVPAAPGWLLLISGDIGQLVRRDIAVWEFADDDKTGHRTGVPWVRPSEAEEHFPEVLTSAEVIDFVIGIAGPSETPAFWQRAEARAKQWFEERSHQSSGT